MDPLPGWKTKLTGILMVIFNVLDLAGVISVSAEQQTAINAGLTALIGLFLALKIDRKK